MRICPTCQGQLPDPTDPIRTREMCGCNSSLVESPSDRSGNGPWPKWHQPYKNCPACGGTGCNQCEGNHQTDYLMTFPNGAFAQFFAIACNPMVFVAESAANPERVNQMAIWAKREMSEAGLLTTNENS